MATGDRKALAIVNSNETFAHNLTLGYPQGARVMVGGYWFEANSDIAAGVAFVEGSLVDQWTQAVMPFSLGTTDADGGDPSRTGLVPAPPIDLGSDEDKGQVLTPSGWDYGVGAWTINVHTTAVHETTEGWRRIVYDGFVDDLPVLQNHPARPDLSNDRQITLQGGWLYEVYGLISGQVYNGFLSYRWNIDTGATFTDNPVGNLGGGAKVQIKEGGTATRYSQPFIGASAVVGSDTELRISLRMAETSGTINPMPSLGLYYQTHIAGSSIVVRCLGKL
ncbi:hypothetical protein NVP1121O_030 [Vibrio phage 1.121.O._10N.286.46.C4]|nr:hypothetical protein NVP1121O_030 [Vibrio phage 1.121.O._10N.286.46.C4]